MNVACLDFGKPIQDAISRIRFAPLSNNLLVSSWDSSLRLYDVESSVLRLEACVEGALLDCCFQTESVAFSAGSDHVIRRFDLNQGIHHIVGNHEDLATCIEYSDETYQLISGGWDKKIMSWDLRMEKGLGCSKYLGVDVESMTLSVWNLAVAVGSSVCIFDLRNLDKPVQARELGMDFRVRCVRSSPYSKAFAVGSIDGRVALEVLDPSNSKDRGYSFRCHPKSEDGRSYLIPVNDIAFNPVICNTFITGDNEGCASAWDARSRRRLYELPRSPCSVASLSYNHEGKLLAVASGDTYQEAEEREDPPRIYIHQLRDDHIGCSSRK